MAHQYQSFFPGEPLLYSRRYRLPRSNAPRHHGSFRAHQSYMRSSSTGYVLESIPAGAYVDMSSIDADNIFFTRNARNPHTGREMHFAPASRVPNINDDERFERIPSVSPPRCSPPQPSGRPPIRSPSPIPPVQQSPSTSNQAQASSSDSPDRRRRSPAPSIQPPKRSTRRELSHKSKSPSTKAYASTSSSQRRRSLPASNQPLRRSSRLLLRNSKSVEQLCVKEKTVPSQTGNRKRKRVESTTSEQPICKAARTRSRQIKTGSQQKSNKLEVALPKTSQKTNPFSFSGVKLEIPNPLQPRRPIAGPKPKPSKRLPHQLLNASQSSSNLPMSTQDSATSSIRSSRRLQAKRIITL